MELQALLVLCGLGVAGAAVILLMGLFSTSGTTYEEAIAQQRKATTELLALAENKGKAKKTSKKANKKLAKKERKESAAAATGSEPESEAPAESGADEDNAPASKPHVEFSPPVVVDVPTDTPPNIKIRKRGKDLKVKPILVNKEDPSCVSDPGSAPINGSAVSNHFEEMHPKDEFELLHSSFLEKALEKKEEAAEKKDKAPKSAKNTKAPSKPAANPEPVKDEAVPERQNTAEGPKEQRKVKKAEKKNVVEEVSVAEEVVPPSPAPSPPAGKGKKKKPEPNVLSLMAKWFGGPNDPMQKLKKQLAEKEKALADELEASQALHAKLKELRATLNAERGRAAAAGRAAEQAAGAARAELHTLQARLQRVLDDNHALGQEKIHLQSKLAAEGEAQAQRVQMELHIQRLSEVKGNVENLKSDIEKAKEDAEKAKASVDKAKEDADTFKKEAEKAKEEAKKVTEEANKLREEIEKLKQQYENVRQESEQQKSKISSEAASLMEQLRLRESELAEVKQLAAHPAHNGLPNSNDDQKRANELAKVESVVVGLKEELSAAQRASADLKEQVASLRSQLQQYQQKNNELRTKNWKVMEALQSAEKSLQAKCARAPPPHHLAEAILKAQETQYKEVASILRSAVPNIGPGSGCDRDWLQAFANSMKNEFQKIESQKKELEKKQLELEKKTEVQAPKDDSRLTEVIAQNEQLQVLLDKYKRVIADTEYALSELQKNVSVEEQRWQQQLADKQRELDTLQQRIAAQVQKKADKVDVILNQAQKPNHSHSFADAERLTEERLMSSLTEKHDSRNGPSQQVSLEEI
ncbi:PREDICTED: ribosome-binding protein 1 [Papilio polytes]|uniref:ribosome-binding protein 1 n=1 Tax=Papilio polytes TaxID=76194 RepID=UPI000676948A|nr:PREDICTED: ribosome-binding protein 1 [Papilio polytes]